MIELIVVTGLFGLFFVAFLLYYPRETIEAIKWKHGDIVGAFIWTCFLCALASLGGLIYVTGSN